MKTGVKLNKNFTTSLPSDVVKVIDSASKELGIQKNDVITQAISAWDKHRRQEKLAESYRRLKKADKHELVALADEDITTWTNE